VTDSRVAERWDPPPISALGTEPREPALPGAFATVLALSVCVPLPVAADQPLGIKAEAVVAIDDNVNRARGDDKISDRFLNVTLSKTFKLPLGRHARLLSRGSIGAERFDRHDDLSRYFAAVQLDLQYRPSAAFGAPTYGVFYRGARDEYESRLRDGYRHSVGVTMHKPLTDRIELFAALAHNIRDAKSTVFDTEDNAARLNLDWSVGRGRATVYAGAEYRNGESVSTAPPALDFVDIAEAIILDDAFSGPPRFAYRFEAHTILTTLGANWALGKGQSLDLSWRRVESESKSKPTYPMADEVRYFDNQLSLAYLLRF
jgi:hypothetical protein